MRTMVAMSELLCAFCSLTYSRISVLKPSATICVSNRQMCMQYIHPTDPPIDEFLYSLADQHGSCDGST